LPNELEITSTSLKIPFFKTAAQDTLLKCPENTKLEKHYM
jgi:hypothetical protein